MRKRIIQRMMAVILCLGLSFGMFDGIPFVKENLSGVIVSEAAIGQLYWPVRNANGLSIRNLSSNHGVGGHKGIDIKNSAGCRNSKIR